MLNILIYAAERDAAFDNEARRELEELVESARQAGSLKFVDVELGKWDAEVDWFDLSVFRSGLIDRRGGIDVIRSYRWTGNEKKREELIAALQQIVSGK